MTTRSKVLLAVVVVAIGAIAYVALNRGDVPKPGPDPKVVESTAKTDVAIEKVKATSKRIDATIEKTEREVVKRAEEARGKARDLDAHGVVDALNGILDDIRSSDAQP